METCTCQHALSGHEDTSDGEHAGACTESDCDCAAATPQEDPEGVETPEAEDDPEPARQDAGTGSSDGDDPDAVVAAAGDPEVPAASDDNAFEMPIMVIEGVDTGDGRFIDPGVLTWRDLPLPVMGILKTTYGHQEAELVGRLDSIERVDISAETNPKTGQPYGDGVSALKATGTFTDLDNAQTMAGLIREGFIRGVSVDLGDVESVLEMVDEDGNVVEDEDPFLDLFWFAADGEDDEKDDDETVKYHFRERMTAARAMGVTICPFPAFEGAFIRLADGTETAREAEPAAVVSSTGVGPIRVMDEPFDRECEPCQNGAVTASGFQAAPMYPPREWFEMPEPDELTPWTVTDDGRAYGHIAGWQLCHTGVTGRCLLATKSRTNYSRFMFKALKTAEGDVIDVGAITLGPEHANADPRRGPVLTADEAIKHYEDTGTVAVMGRATDGKFGIWFCGALEPDLTELQVRKLRASVPSGDWRAHGRGVEMIAVLATNTPGFLTPRAHVASGRTLALVASGVVQGPAARDRSHTDPQVASLMRYVLDRDAEELRRRVHTTQTAAMSAAADRLRARVHKS